MMTISLRGQTIVVTGGAVRLGRAIALECARAGANVAITYNESEDAARSCLGAMQATAPAASRFAILRADLRDAGQIHGVTARVLELFGRADGLVNNAAIFRRTPFETLSEADFDDHIAANLKAPFLLCRAFGRHFQEQGSGAIVNIADIYGVRPLKNYAPYCVSKAGLIMLTETLALSLAPQVRVNCLCPGTILESSEAPGQDEEMEVLQRRIPLGRLGTPEEIAQTTVFLLGGPSFISGAVLPVDGAQRLRS